MFDADGDGVITIEELKTLISKVGGDMSEGEAKALINQVKTLKCLMADEYERRHDIGRQGSEQGG